MKINGLQIILALLGQRMPSYDNKNANEIGLDIIPDTGTEGAFLHTRYRNPTFYPM